MNKNLYRQEAIDNASSLEEFDNYMKTPNIGFSCVIISAIVFLLCLVAFVFLYKIPQTFDENAIIVNNNLIIYANADISDKITMDSKIVCNNQTLDIISIETNPIAHDDAVGQVGSEYVAEKLNIPKWSIIITADITGKDFSDNTVYSAKLIANEESIAELK